MKLVVNFTNSFKTRLAQVNLADKNDISVFVKKNLVWWWNKKLKEKKTKLIQIKQNMEWLKKN